MITVDKMSIEDVEIALHWAANEGWNPGLDDASAFFHADQNGFLMVKNDAKPVACISVIKQADQHGFLGLYISHPECRGHGFGWTAWQAGIKYLHGRTIGLDGVPAQQDNYRKSGFAYHYRNVRFSGNAKSLFSVDETDNRLSHSKLLIQAPELEDIKSLHDLDSLVHGLTRRDYLNSWLTDAPTRQTLICKDGDQLLGFGTIRACNQGFKIGPLIAQSADIAQLLVSALANRFSTNELILDVPEPNSAAIDLAERLGLTPAFETARMYRGNAPEYQLDSLFGVTSFELG